MQVRNRLEHLNSVGSTNGLSKTAIHFTLVSYRTQRHILQIKTEYIIFSHFGAVVCNYIFVVELLEPIQLFLQRLDFYLVNTVVLVDEVQFLNAKNLPSIKVLCFVDLSSYSLANHAPLCPLPQLAVDLLLRFFLDKVIFLHYCLELAFKDSFLIQILRSVTRINLVERLWCIIRACPRCLVLGCWGFSARTLNV